VLFAEPLKKKKKMDPNILKARDERRRKKLEKQIRRLEKNARQLKPIEDLEVPFNLIDEKQQRLRKLPVLSVEEQEYRSVLLKKWAKYKNDQYLNDFQLLDRMINSQKKALDELRYESEELYQHAIQPDIDMVPVVCKGPVRTPPSKDYPFLDGDYINTTKLFEGEEKK
jgi:large subunit ribosomal protein L40